MSNATIQNELDRLSEAYPAAELKTGQRLHVFKADRGAWEVWLNTEVSDFDGLCIADAPSRDQAIVAAVEVLEEAISELLKPPRA